jgi:hypothetical protein
MVDLLKKFYEEIFDAYNEKLVWQFRFSFAFLVGCRTNFGETF